MIKRVKDTGVFSLGVSNTTLAELYFGAYNSKYIKINLHNISVFKKYLTIYSDSEYSAELFGEIKSNLKKTGNIIEDFDIYIANNFIDTDYAITN